MTNSRRVKKSHRRLLFAGLFGAILVLFCGYPVVYFDKETSKPLADTDSPQVALAKDIQFAWPTVGQAAVGTVEAGFLARSSDREMPRPIASMAKIITALAIIKKQPLKSGQPGPSFTLTAKDVANYHAYVANGGSVLPVYEGMVLTQYQAMQAMLIPSANNIAEMLVERVFGSEEAYVSYAQNMLQEMGLSQTVVTDASGFSPATVGTPSELVVIGIAALKIPVIAEIVARPQAEIPGVGSVTNTNGLLGANGVVGIKTGTTGSAGSCLLSAARYVDKERKEVIIVGVIMGDTSTADLFYDSRRLLASAKKGLVFDIRSAG